MQIGIRAILAMVNWEFNLAGVEWCGILSLLSTWLFCYNILVPVRGIPTCGLVVLVLVLFWCCALRLVLCTRLRPKPQVEPSSAEAGSQCCGSWCRYVKSTIGPNLNKELFYLDERPKSAYRDWVRTVIIRCP